MKLFEGEFEPTAKKENEEKEKKLDGFCLLSNRDMITWIVAYVHKRHSRERETQDAVSAA